LFELEAANDATNSLLVDTGRLLSGRTISVLFPLFRPLDDFDLGMVLTAAAGWIATKGLVDPSRFAYSNPGLEASRKLENPKLGDVPAAGCTATSVDSIS
jgi:hypothetical protein